MPQTFRYESLWMLVVWVWTILCHPNFKIYIEISVMYVIMRKSKRIKCRTLYTGWYCKCQGSSIRQILVVHLGACVNFNFTLPVLISAYSTLTAAWRFLLRTPLLVSLIKKLLEVTISRCSRRHYETLSLDCTMKHMNIFYLFTPYCIFLHYFSIYYYVAEAFLCTYVGVFYSEIIWF